MRTIQWCLVGIVQRRDYPTRRGYKRARNFFKRLALRRFVLIERTFRRLGMLEKAARLPRETP